MPEFSEASPPQGGIDRAVRCIQFVISEEGRLVYNPRDPGGLTKYGISQRAYPNVDIRALTYDDAAAIYRRDYWNAIRGDALPPGLDLIVLDCAVNMGQGTAIKLLQEAAQVTIDGVLGEKTLAAARQHMPTILHTLCALRGWRYEINKNEDVFGKGWFNRLFRVFATAWDMRK